MQNCTRCIWREGLGRQHEPPSNTRLDYLRPAGLCDGGGALRVKDTEASHAVWREPDKVKGARLAWNRPDFVKRSWEMYHRDSYERFTRELMEKRK